MPVLTVGLNDIKKAFNRFLNSSLTSDFFDAVGQELTSLVVERFEKEEEPSGKSWQKSKKDSGQTLTSSSMLRRSITHKVLPDGVEVGTNLIYAAIHQFGGVIKPVRKKNLSFVLANGARIFTKEVNIPARPYLGFDNDEKQTIEKIFERIFNA